MSERRKSNFAGPLLVLLLGVGQGACLPWLAAAESIGFSGAQAFQDLKRLVAFGPRPSGSQRLAASREWIIHRLHEAGVLVEEDRFTSATPLGEMGMTNILVKFPGRRPQVVIVAGHYDTARLGGPNFVGANDGGSSASLLLELARVLARRKNGLTIWLVFFDGEEAVQSWSNTDGLYGSRHLAQKLAASGELSRIAAMILADMVGDAHLDIHREFSSTPWLTDIIFGTAARLGYSKYFLNDPRAAVDDHVPFLNAGVAATDLIDFNYGPDNSYWHTAQDTVNHCSPVSLTIVGRVVLASLDELERSPHTH